MTVSEGMSKFNDIFFLGGEISEEEVHDSIGSCTVLAEVWAVDTPCNLTCHRSLNTVYVYVCTVTIILSWHYSGTADGFATALRSN